MADDLGVRLGLLVGLAVLGASLGWAGTALGYGGPITDTGSPPAFVVSESDVTFSDGARTVTVFDDVTRTETVSIAADDEGFTVERTGPLTDAERRRAREIARANETVRRHLAAIDDPTLVVEPIRNVPTDRVSGTVEIERGAPNGTVWTNASAENESVVTVTVQRVENVSVNETDDSVTLHRGTTYAEDTVVVELRESASDEVRYEAQVDLVEERVVVVTEE
jgi:hypothetical protein